MEVVFIVVALVFVVGLTLTLAAVKAIYSSDRLSSKIASLVIKTGK